MHRCCRFLAVIICFALDIVTTQVCRCDPHTQDFQALTGVPDHAVPENRSGGPIFILALVAVCLFVCLQRIGTGYRYFFSKGPPHAQSLWCNESRTVCRFVIVLVWRGESRALDTIMAIKLQPEEPGEPPRDGSGSTPSMPSVCIGLISPQLFLLLCAKAEQPIRALPLSRAPAGISWKRRKHANDKLLLVQTMCAHWNLFHDF